MKTITIYNVRQSENDYAALSDIVEKLSNFRYESTSLTSKEDTVFLDAISALCNIQERIFTEAKKAATKYLKTA